MKRALVLLAAVLLFVTIITLPTRGQPQAQPHQPIPPRIMDIAVALAQSSDPVVVRIWSDGFRSAGHGQHGAEPVNLCGLHGLGR